MRPTMTRGDLVSGAVPAALLALGAWSHRWVCEDAFIFFRVVDQLLAGNGPVFNAGERVEAFTSPLWLGLLTAWRATGLRVEDGSLVMGITAAAVGLLVAVMAAARRRPAGAVVPIGAMVLAVTAAAWDFSASGLEMGLALGWIGTSYAMLAGAAAAERRLEAGAYAWFGAGILVRPDLGLFALGFLGIGLAMARHQAARGGASWPGAIAAWAAAPGLWQIFRLGYYGAWISNSSIAKEPGLSHWTNGARYLLDFVHVYDLWLAAPLLVALAWLTRDPAWREVRWLEPAVFGLGALHAVYVARVGGDFMHGRFVVPAYFAMLVPFLVVPMASLRRPLALAATVALGAWCVAAGFTLHPRYRFGRTGIADERRVYIDQSGRPHPVRLEDYDATVFGREGRNLRREAEAGGRRFLVALTDDPAAGYLPGEEARRLPLADGVDPSIAVGAPAWNIGIIGAHAGPRVLVADRLGLADPVGSRLHVAVRGRPGHEKLLPLAVTEARFAAPGPTDRPEVMAARRVLAGPEARELLEAVTAPLTAERFVANALAARRLTALRFRFDGALADTTR
jgi:arabinofuranosyltransferase